MSDWGYYWVERFEGDKPSIAYKPKTDSVWLFPGEARWAKMVHTTGRSKPAKILKKVDDFNE